MKKILETTSVFKCKYKGKLDPYFIFIKLVKCYLNHLVFKAGR